MFMSKLPTLVHVRAFELVPPAEDIRDRTSAEYHDFVDRLVADLKERGIQVPLLGYRDGQLIRVIDGGTRREALLLAGITDPVPVLVYDEKPDAKSLKIGMLQANAMRQDLSDIEYARQYIEIINEFGISQADLSRQLHHDSTVVNKRLQVLKWIPADLLHLIGKGKDKVAFSTAHALTELRDEQKIRDNMSKAAQGLLKRDSAVKIAQDAKGHTGSKKAKPVKCRTPRGIVIVIPRQPRPRHCAQ
jgi:ParB/RepB/Spo0J family partition protein